MSFLACSINSIRSRCLEVLYRPAKSLLILLLILLSSITMCRGRSSGCQKDFFSSSFPTLSSPVCPPLRVSSHLPTLAPVADCSCLLLDACWRVQRVESCFSVVLFQPQPWAGAGLRVLEVGFSPTNRDLRVGSSSSPGSSDFLLFPSSSCSVSSRVR